MPRIEFSMMQQTIFRALQKAGLDEESAHTCARIHTESSCDGISSHGLNRVARFVDYVKKGWIDIHAKPELEKSLGAIAIYNGNRGIGITNALFAVEKAAEMAKRIRRRHCRTEKQQPLDAWRKLWLACGKTRHGGDLLDEYADPVCLRGAAKTTAWATTRS